MLIRTASLCLLLFTLPNTLSAAIADDAPSWLQQAAGVTAPTYDRDVPAVVLLQDSTMTVDNEGKITTQTRFAIRILTREGRVFAGAAELYLTKVGKVKDLRAWLIRSNGTVKKYGGDATFDHISDQNDIYDEYRVKEIDASQDADAGMVFGYESSTEDRPLFHQERLPFQSRLPSLVSRYTLVLPSGWSATSVTFNHTTIAPSTNGTSYTWELQSLPPIRPEPASPETDSLAPIVAISYFPNEGIAGKSNAFEDWRQVSRWASELHDPQSVADNAVAAKAKELTANVTTELEKIKAIGSFVQGLQYISIDIGIGRGNGYRPHPAAVVLSKAYGDCKDKANLMRAMLQSIGIVAYPVAIFLGDPTHVRSEWPSPRQFNHCIVAIKISDNTVTSSTIQHPTLGRLLIFDATDEHTLLGDLPVEEQGSLALIIAGDAGGLERMPTLPPESSRLDRNAQIALAGDGSITA
ncbi:MAG: DUF3857 domain-containing protein, partial [Pyrinomonadaceae bacterium]